MSWNSQQALLIEQKIEIENLETINQGLRVNNIALSKKLTSLQAILEMRGNNNLTQHFIVTPQQSSAFCDIGALSLDEEHVMEYLMKTNHELQERIALLHAELASLESAIAAHRTHGTIHHQIEMLEVRKFQLQQQELRQNQQLADLRHTNAQLREETEPAGKVLMQLRKERDELAQEVKKLETIFQAASQKTAAAEREVAGTLRLHSPTLQFFYILLR